MTSDSRHSAASEANGTGFLAVCGISHGTASLTEREPFHIGRSALVPAVKLFKTLPGVKEVVLVATCNRFEAYTFLEEGTDAFDTTCAFFGRLKGVDPSKRRELFYVRHGSTVARHLFRVISGIESLVLGEYQIQNQVKEAYSAACSAKGAGKALHRLFHAAFRTGKAVRSKTALGAGQYSVAGVAVHLLEERLDGGDPVLLVGVNENTRIVADGLSSAGFRNLLFANRTAYKAEKIAARYGGEWCGLDGLSVFLGRCRGVVSCTGAPGHVIEAGDLERCFESEDAGPELIVDMAVPRDVESPQRLPEGAKIVDLEDLKAFLETQANGRRAEIPAAESIIEDVVANFQVWIESAFDPGVANLAKEYDRIRKKLLDEAKGHFKPEDHAELERVSRRLMQHFLRVPARSLLESPDPALEAGACRRRREERETARESKEETAVEADSPGSPATREAVPNIREGCDA